MWPYLSWIEVVQCIHGLVGLLLILELQDRVAGATARICLYRMLICAYISINNMALPIVNSEVVQCVHGLVGLLLVLKLQDRVASATAPDDTNREHVLVADHRLEVANLNKRDKFR